MALATLLHIYNYNIILILINLHHECATICNRMDLKKEVFLLPLQSFSSALVRMISRKLQ